MNPAMFKVVLQSEDGEEDSDSIAVITEEGLHLSSPLHGDLVISLEDLVRITRDPRVEPELDQVEFMTIASMGV